MCGRTSAKKNENKSKAAAGSESNFLMSIQYTRTVQGYGTIAEGAVMSGSVKLGDEVILYSIWHLTNEVISKIETKVTKIIRYHKEAIEAKIYPA